MIFSLHCKINAATTAANGMCFTVTVALVFGLIIGLVSGKEVKERKRFCSHVCIVIGRKIYKNEV